MLEIRRFSDWAAATPYRDAWNKLVMTQVSGSDGLPSLFQTFEWNHSWWRAFGASHELVLLGAFDADELVGVAPLMINRRNRPIPTKTIRIIGGLNFASDFCGFARAPGRTDVIDAFIGWLDSNPALWHEIDFMSVPEGSPELAAVTSDFARQRFKPEVSFLFDAPTRVLGDPAQDKDLVNRDSLKRHTNWFKKQGNLSCAHIESADEIKAKLDAFFQQHIERRSITPDPSQFHDPREKEFYRILVDSLTPLGWLRFFCVDLDGKAIAYHFGFEFGQKLYWYKPTFDIKLIKKSPGEVLLKALFEYAVGRGLREFDFLAGSEQFKYRFSNQVRKLYRVRGFRSWPHYALFKLDSGGRALARKLLRRKPKNQQ